MTTPIDSPTDPKKTTPKSKAGGVDVPQPTLVPVDSAPTDPIAEIRAELDRDRAEAVRRDAEHAERTERLLSSLGEVHRALDARGIQRPGEGDLPVPRSTPRNFDDEQLDQLAARMLPDDVVRLSKRVFLVAEADRWQKLGVSPETHILVNKKVKVLYDGKPGLLLPAGIGDETGAYLKEKFSPVKMGTETIPGWKALVLKGHARELDSTDLPPVAKAA